LPKDFVITEIRIPDRVKVIEAQEYWSSTLVAEGKFITRGLSSIWFENRSSAVLKVPPAIIPEERNYVLNVLHPDFEDIEFLPSMPFQFDPRLNPIVR
jgi:RES domain-containing protein